VRFRAALDDGAAGELKLDKILLTYSVMFVDSSEKMAQVIE
jgi:hypothetical protein